MDLGIVVDVETTGMSLEEDCIIEIGLLCFKMEEPNFPVITEAYGWLQDPGRPLSTEIIQLTGLTDFTLQGQKINWKKVRKFFDKASFIIAHNAAFDANFLRKQLELKGCPVHWVCSLKHINWIKHGFSTKSLNYLAADHGFINPFAHRALFDCATTFRLIKPYFEELIENSYVDEYEISAFGASFSTKDLLKKSGYFWDSQNRVWKKNILEPDLSRERNFLIKEIYKGAARHLETLLPKIIL